MNAWFALALVVLAGCSPIAVVTNPWTNAQIEYARIQCLKADKVWIETQQHVECAERKPR